MGNCLENAPVKLYYVTCIGGKGKPSFALYMSAKTSLHARLYAARQYKVTLADVEAKQA